ncbi:MAG: RES family NAD+ phosphorylase [Ruegeria sp.]|uniref:RES family NAD+ phosphorylase n=1 Tax=Ruegeria sp. TaxID=1879320 RepID=UPI00349E94F3
MLTFSGIVWRILYQARADRPLSPARASEGRFHHSGQTALYASLTPEGAGVAIRRYVGADDPPRVILPLQVTNARLADLRGRPEVSVIWQDLHAAGAPSPTWTFSDQARREGAQGLLYSSRSRPELSHLVLFDCAADLIRPAGAAAPWPPGS